MSIESAALELYKEQTTQGRHLETQRLEVTKFILGAATALLAVMATLKFSIHCLPLAGGLILLGIVGQHVSKAYVDRFEGHMNRARQCRQLLNQQLNGALTQTFENSPVVKVERIRTFWFQVYNWLIGIGIVCMVVTVLVVAGRARRQSGDLWTKLWDQVSFTE